MNGRAQADATCERIEWLTSCYLEKIASGNSETLFKDLGDGRYWEETFPQGQMHGGGPPQLRVLSPEEAGSKYGYRD